MTWDWVLIIGSLAFAPVVIVGANIWALRDGPGRELAQRERFEEELRDLLAAETRP